MTTVGFEIPVLLHLDSYVSPSAKIGVGSVVMPKAVVQNNARIGKGCIISSTSGAVIDHDAVVGDYCHVNAEVVVAARSRIPGGIKIDYGVVYRDTGKMPVADRELEDIHKRDFGTEISFFEFTG